MKLFLLRHGQSEDNIAKVYSRPECSLTDKGRKEIASAGNLLSSVPFKGVFVSPYRRTRQSGEILEKYIDSNYQIREDIHEMYFGKFTGLTYDEIVHHYPREAAIWGEDPYHHGPPDGESLLDVYHRAEIFTEQMKKLNGNYLAVSHEGFIRMVLCTILEDPFQYFKFRLSNGSTSVVELNEEFSYISQLSYKTVTRP